MNRRFETGELRTFVETTLGFKVRSFERLPGRSASVNFKAVRAEDGFPFVVKCLTGRAVLRLPQLLRNLQELQGSMAVSRLFAEFPAQFGDWSVVYLSWCAGERRFPDRLSAAEFQQFLDDYLAFSQRLQRVNGVLPELSFWHWGRELAGAGKGWRQGLLDRRIRQLANDPAAPHLAERLQVVHGDFHAGNFLFSAGRIAGIFDLTDLRKGYPTEDLVRYFSSALEHVSPLAFVRRRKLFARFAEAVTRLPYSRREWLTAVSVYQLYKASSLWEPQVGWGKLLKFFGKMRTYERLRQVILSVGEAST